MGQPKIREADLLMPTLRYLNQYGPLGSRDLIDRLTELFRPTDDNMRIVGNGEPAFNQIVRNMISNRFTGNNIINQGYAAYDEAAQVMSITEEGRRFYQAHEI